VGCFEPQTKTPLIGTAETFFRAPCVSLDPANWQQFRAQGHRMLDDMLDYIEHIRSRPVWQPIPDDIRARFFGAVPRSPAPLAAVHDEFMQFVLPFAIGNAHPGFMGWVQGGGTPVGMLAEMLAAGLNANCGGRDHIPIEVERQIVRWMRNLFGFPETASGLFLTGTSLANYLAVLIARDAVLGFDVRRKGVPASKSSFTAYSSSDAHSCIAQAMDLSGLGSDALRLIPVDDHHRINLDALQRAIASDRQAGFTPFFIAGTAGTVNTGAIDNLSGLATIAHRERLWFHIDGAFGALAIMAPDLAPRLTGIERANSLAFDFHKLGQVPYDAGFLLVRDGALHRQAFSSSASYLMREDRGMAGGSPWPCDFGPDLSRAFRALKTWFTFKVFGTEALGAAISSNCALARYLEARVRDNPELQLLAPVELHIVCFRYRAKDIDEQELDRVNSEIVIRLQESGVVAPSSTLLKGRVTIRAAITNHRTTRAEIDALIDSTVRAGRLIECRQPATQETV